MAAIVAGFNDDFGESVAPFLTVFDARRDDGLEEALRRSSFHALDSSLGDLLI